MYSKILKYQLYHLISIVISIVLFQFLSTYNENVITGNLFGINTNIWLWLAVLTPIIHQLYVFSIWRYELYANTFTKKFGLQKAFKFYSIGFSILFVFRLVSIILLSFSNTNTLYVSSSYAYALVGIISPFIIYLFYSVKTYFTIQRAFGIDHFDKEYNVPYVKKGIFKYTNNGMYVIGLSILYIPGLLLFSEAGILVAFFNHLYIWVHYYTTELPDMKYIYKEKL